MIKVVHSADIHIRQDGDLNSISALRELIKSVNDNDTDILLISGDLFDSPFPSEECVKEVISCLAECHAEVFISPGNHDPYISCSVYDSYVFSENVHIFSSPEVKCIRARCGADIYGYAFRSYSSDRIPLPEVNDKNRISIYSIHADLGNFNSVYAPVSVTDIELTGADYVALGHIHKRTDILRTGNTRYSYSGSLCSRDFGECGKKGAIFAEFEKTDGVCSASFKFVPISKEHFEILKVNISDVETEEELLSKLISALSQEGYDKNTSLRLFLKGELSPNIHISSTFFKPIEDGLALLEIIDKTSEKLLESNLEKDKTIRGEVYKVLQKMLQSDNEEQRQATRMILRLALSALKNEDPLEILEIEEEDDL